MNRFKVRRRRCFTLIEVVIAFTILTGSLIGLFQLLMSARFRIAGSAEEWERTHMLVQAAEYFLLHSEKTASIPARFFSYDDFRVECEYQDSDTGGIPAEYLNLTTQSTLRTGTVRLIRRSNNEVVDSLSFERLKYGNDHELVEE